MKKILNKRLETLSAFILDNEKVIDIGCDHAFLGIYLYLNRKNMKIVSSDINTGPLQRAKENLEKYHLENKIELRKGNGLEALSSDITTIIISGMGGITISDILKDINCYSNVSKLVLSPNNEFVFLRKSLKKNGFTITKEQMVEEKGKFYLISEYHKGNEKINYFFGKLDLNDKIVKDYYQNIYLKNRNILKRLSFIQKIKNYHLIRENNVIKKKVSFK